MSLTSYCARSLVICPKTSRYSITLTYRSLRCYACISLILNQANLKYSGHKTAGSYQQANGHMQLALLLFREQVASNIMIGQFAAEALILAEPGNTVGAIQIAGTTNAYQIPFFVVACDYVILGEEIFAAEHTLPKTDSTWEAFGQKTSSRPYGLGLCCTENLAGKLPLPQKFESAFIGPRAVMLLPPPQNLTRFMSKYPMKQARSAMETMTDTKYATLFHLCCRNFLVQALSICPKKQKVATGIA